MIQVMLSEQTDARLQALARPFETREGLIDRMAQAELARRAAGSGQGEVPPVRQQAEEWELDPDNHASLTHTKVVEAIADGTPIVRPDWNSLLEAMLRIAKRKLGSTDAVREIASANTRIGKYEKDGYRFLPDLGLSVQGVDANKAWSHALGLARTVGISLEVRFFWRDKHESAHPGKSATLRWSPSNTPVGEDVFAGMSPFTVRQAVSDDSRSAAYGEEGRG